MRQISLIGLLFLALSNARAETWQDADGSEFSFEVEVEGVPTSGAFRDFDVKLEFDPAAPGDAELLVVVDLTAADLGDPDMNEVLFDPAWFDVGQFDEAIFRSDEIAGRSSAEFIATGMLDLKGHVKPVTVPFTWSAFGERATMTGEFVMQRTDFGVGSGEWASDDAIGIDVRLTFAVELVRKE